MKSVYTDAAPERYAAGFGRRAGSGFGRRAGSAIEYYIATEAGLPFRLFPLAEAFSETAVKTFITFFVEAVLSTAAFTFIGSFVIHIFSPLLCRLHNNILLKKSRFCSLLKETAVEYVALRKMEKKA